MRIIWDARGHTMYPIGSDGGLTSGTVQMIRRIAAGLAERGHTVHVVTADLEAEEQRGPTLWYWGPENFPTRADVVVMTMHVDPNTPFEAPVLVLATYGCDPNLGPNGEWAAGVEAFPVFTDTHGRLLRQLRPTVPEERCFLTGLGVDPEDYNLHGGLPFASWRHKTHRLLYANDPARGLLPLLDIFEHIRREIPDASLHVAYDFTRQVDARRWEHSALAEQLLECERRVHSTPGVRVLEGLDRAGIIREELECQVHCMPSDPPNVGTQIHGLTQLECAAAGAALVLSDVEAFPELFGEGAAILPVVGRFLPEQERRANAQDYAAVVIELMKDPARWAEASKRARALAERHTWGHVVDRWEEMLTKLEGARVG